MEPEEILVTEWGLWIQWVVNFFLSILHLLYIIYPNFTCVEFGIQIRTHKVAEYRIRIQNTACVGNQFVFPACRYIPLVKFASVSLRTAGKICQRDTASRWQAFRACRYILLKSLCTVLYCSVPTLSTLAAALLAQQRATATRLRVRRVERRARKV